MDVELHLPWHEVKVNSKRLLIDLWCPLYRSVWTPFFHLFSPICHRAISYVLKGGLYIALWDDPELWWCFMFGSCWWRRLSLAIKAFALSILDGKTVEKQTSKQNSFDRHYEERPSLLILWYERWKTHEIICLFSLRFLFRIEPAVLADS